MKYSRILLKLSGESLMGDKQFGIDNTRLSLYAQQIKELNISSAQQIVEIDLGNYNGVYFLRCPQTSLGTLKLIINK